MKMKIIIITIWCIFCTFIGACSHEKDLARNFNETGDACAWFYEIKESK